MLSFYYLLVIRFSWRESQLRRVRKWFLSVPMLGVIASFVALPHIGNGYMFCVITPPPLADSYWPMSILQSLPIFSCLLIATVNTLLVYAAVRKQEKRGLKWRFPSTKGTVGHTVSNGRLSDDSVGNDEESPHNEKRDTVATSMRRVSSQILDSAMATLNQSRLQRATFWQSLFYLGAFYFSWFVLAVVNVSFVNDRVALVPYWCWALLSFVAPLQGFTNFFVYVRPKLIARRERRDGAKSPVLNSESPSKRGTQSPLDTSTKPSTDHEKMEQGHDSFSTIES